MRPSFAGPFPIRAFPDPFCLTNQYYGFVHRVARAMPHHEKRLADLLLLYSQKLLEDLFTPCDINQFNESFEHYASTCGKPRAYVDKLRRAFESTIRIRSEDLIFKSFIKDESYDVDLSSPAGCSKFPRSIQAPSDVVKCYLLPYIHAIDEHFFSSRYFVKKIPSQLRAAHIFDHIGFQQVGVNDYSSFECHLSSFRTQLFTQFFTFFLRNHRQGPQILRLLTAVGLGRNTCRFKQTEMQVTDRLMSGLPWTSTINSFQNLVYTSFSLARAKGHLTVESAVEFTRQCPIFIEGDDSIFPASKEDQDEINSTLSGLGCVAVLEVKDSVFVSNFCGIFMSRQFELLCDPIKVFCNFFTIPLKYLFSKTVIKKQLMRAKALSYLFTYPSCPLIAPLAWCVLKMTENTVFSELVLVKMLPELSFKFRDLAPELLLKIDTKPYPTISLDARTLVSEEFGFSIEYQIAFEHQLVLWSEGKCHELPYHENWRKYSLYSKNYVGSVPPYMPDHMPTPSHDCSTWFYCNSTQVVPPELRSKLSRDVHRHLIIPNN